MGKPVRTGARALQIQADSPWWRAAVVLIVPLHWLITAGVLGLGLHHVLLGLLMLLLVAKGAATRRLLWIVFPFWLTGVFYEYSELWAASGPEVHVADLYRAELEWFGVDVGGGLEVPALAAQRYPAAWLDVICGIAYIAYLFVPMVAAVILTFRRPLLAERIAWGFLVVMLLGMAIYRLYPAAPPWYVAEHGLGPPAGIVPASPAGLARFDELVGFPFFASWYGHSAQVYAAMPSLHVAYPVALVAATVRLGWSWRAATALFALTVAFAAVYLGHHYVLDVLAGLAVGLLADQVARVGQVRLRGLAGAGRPRASIAEAPPGSSVRRPRQAQRAPGLWTNPR